MFQLIDLIIVNPIVNILFVIFNFVGDFGVAIILFTILVKILTWPLIKRQIHQTKLMRKIQPELAKIKRNCKGNRQLESIQMLDLYKRNNIKPFRSILTIVIQIQIFIAIFTAINVVVAPTTSNNISSRAYPVTNSMDRISSIIKKQKSYLKDPKTAYDFKPKLFNTIDLSAKAGISSISAIIILIFAISSALAQYFVSKQLNPSAKKGGFKKLIQEASKGKDPNQSDMNAVISQQMTIMMPVMMFFIAISLPGALVFYYLLISLVSLIQQKIILDQTVDEMEISADKAIIKKLNSIKEAEVIQNKKSGTRITRISAQDRKKSTLLNKRRKHE